MEVSELHPHCLASLEMKSVGSMEKSILEICWNWFLSSGDGCGINFSFL